MDKITAESEIESIVAGHPETIDLFAGHGIDGETIGKLIKSGAKTKLHTVLDAKSINKTVFIERLNATINQKRDGENYVFAEFPEGSAPDMLAYVPCTIKHVFRDLLEETIAEYTEKTGKKFSCYVPVGCGSNDQFENLYKETDPDHLPDIIISLGFGDYFRKQFTAQHLDRFTAVYPQEINPHFTESHMIDPFGHYTIYAAYPYVIVADKNKLGDLPMPKRWIDLLNPIYKNNIIIGGSEDEVSEVLLLYIYKEVGETGVDMLVDNVKDLWHGAQMAKHAGMQSDTGAALYVMPYFFGNTIPEGRNAAVLVPEEGAMVTPLYMLAKKERLAEVKLLTDYVTSKKLGDKMAESFYPFVNADAVSNPITDCKLDWIGWEFIRGNDIFALREELSKRFLNRWKKRASAIGSR